MHWRLTEIGATDDLRSGDLRTSRERNRSCRARRYLTALTLVAVVLAWHDGANADSFVEEYQVNFDLTWSMASHPTVAVNEAEDS